MFELVVCFLVAFVCTFISCGIINREQVRLEHNALKKLIKCFPSEKKKIIYCTVMLLYTIGLVMVLQLVYTGDTVVSDVKTIALASLMWPMAAIDYQSLRIPNKLVLLGLIYRAIILIFELLFFREGLLYTLLFEGIGAIAIGALLLLSLIVIKNGIGMGDIKFFMLMGLFLGVYRLISAVLLSLFIALGISLYKLIVKKEGKKTQFAFGPVIAVGSLISFILFGN